MRALVEMDTIQVEITNACVRSCANCTRLCGHEPRAYFMDELAFTRAVESLDDFPHMIGVMGGEPLLHPQFERLCEILRAHRGRMSCGLWTTLPPQHVGLAEVICQTFGNIFINDHSRGDIFHAPVLVSAEEVFPNSADMFLAVEHCWVQESWSASINPKGAYFCEVAAALHLLMDGPDGWPITSDWWKRVPKDYTAQQEWACTKCGCALPLTRRSSLEEVDDISPLNAIRLRHVSRKVKRKAYVVSNCQLADALEPMAAYKDLEWRQRIAARYGIHLAINAKGFNEPSITPLRAIGDDGQITIFEKLRRQYGDANTNR